MQDINKLEQVQRRATKFILKDYLSDYRSRLLHLNLLPLMYIFEFFDIKFLVKILKYPSNFFNIYNYVSFSTNLTRSSGVKLNYNTSTTNKQRHHYFIRICRLWNSLPIIDLNLSIHTIKSHLKSFFWNHFITNFDASNSHTYHFLCPCSNCHKSPPTTNFSHLRNS